MANITEEFKQLKSLFKSGLDDAKATAAVAKVAEFIESLPKRKLIDNLVSLFFF